jgi:hypothetical protein
MTGMKMNDNATIDMIEAMNAMDTIENGDTGASRDTNDNGDINESGGPDDAGSESAADDYTIQEDRLWRADGWTARVIKNEDDEGWAVAMIKDGEPEPALVGPWTMGRDKKNPKPLDTSAFNTLVKTASEVLRRHEQQLHAMLHKSIAVTVRSATFSVSAWIEGGFRKPA